MQCKEDRLPAAPSAPDYGCQSQVSLKCKNSQDVWVFTKASETQSYKKQCHRRLIKSDQHQGTSLLQHQQLALVFCSILWFHAKQGGKQVLSPKFLQLLQWTNLAEMIITHQLQS